MIHSVVDRIREISRNERPWLIVGKGPSLETRQQYDVEDYNRFSLNHACQVVRPHVAHFTDLEAFADVARWLWNERIPVCLPYHPHVAMKPSRYTLPHFIGIKQMGVGDVLQKLEDADLLWSYNSTLAPTEQLTLPKIKVRYFSAVAVFHILATAGEKLIHSIGVDGGTEYAKDFDKKDRLANGRKSFDVQFEVIAKTCRQQGIVYRRLGTSDAVC